MPIFFKKGRSRSEADAAHLGGRIKAKCLPSGKAGSHSKPSKVCTAKCRCCGTALSLANDESPIKCTVCSVTTCTQDPLEVSTENARPLSLVDLRRVIDSCYSALPMLRKHGVQECREVFDPVSTYLTSGFQSVAVLRNSFSPHEGHEVIDIRQLSEFYLVILKLPTRKPFYKMLRACNELLKRSDKSVEELRWLFIIWLNPVIRKSLIQGGSMMGTSPQINSISYEIAKRCIGYLSNVPAGPAMNELLHYLKCMPVEEFRNQVEIVNLYINFQMLRLSQRGAFHRGSSSSRAKKLVDDCEFFSDRDSLSGENLSMIPGNCQFKLYAYASNWRLKCAVNLMAILHTANNTRGEADECSKLSSNEFYNTMFDFIDFKQDYLSWRQQDEHSLGSLENTAGFESVESRFALCSYPFLLSIGVKKMVMDFETKRIMNTEAERAFLSSLDTRQTFQVALRIRVRRSNIVEDSLKCIREHTGDLMKPLKVQFVDEPGVDAGGLRKEWFLLLIKALLRPEERLFHSIEESGFSWFSPHLSTKTERIKFDKLYFLSGIVIGLAIFNGIILDLSFPTCLYRKLCAESLTFGDYEELHPEAATNLKKMLAYDKPDFAEVFGLTFETTSEEKADVELSPNGRHRRVTSHNKKEFVQLWTNFHLNKSIDTAFEQFSLGFRQVFSQCQSIQLFNSAELELLLCGNREDDCYDFRTLRSVTRYAGGFTNTSQTIEWFWDVLQQWDMTLKRKVLSFITGSDRVPPTGICNLTFKICRIGANDSESLPVAHTCFNEVCLWEYSSKEKLENKLWWAVTQSEGFGFK